MKYLVASAAMLLVTVCLSAQQKDTLFFLNGSRVIGKVKSVKLGVVTFDPDDANDITVQLQKLKSISAVSKVYRIETIRNLVYFGRMRPAADEHYVEIIRTVGDTVLLHLEEISILYAYKDSFKQRFSGSVGVGFNFTRSSNFGRLNVDGNVNYKAQKEEITFAASGIYTITDTTFSRDREDLTLKYNHYFTPTWFGTLFLKYQRNIELGLERRFQEGIGAGNKFITSKHVYAWTRAGAVINQERNTEDENSGTLTELFGQMEFNFFRFTKPEVNLLITETFYYSLSQSGRARNDAQIDLNWEIIKDLRLNLSLYGNYDNQPPTEGSRKFDFGIVFGFNYKFG